jgi:hypothetical protein
MKITFTTNNMATLFVLLVFVTTVFCSSSVILSVGLNNVGQHGTCFISKTNFRWYVSFGI